MSKPFFKKGDTTTVAVLLVLILGCVGVSLHYWSRLSELTGDDALDAASPGALLLPPPGFARFRTEGDAQYLWASGPIDPEQKGSDWFDLTGTPLPLEKFNHGIGRDRIRAIDKPVFVGPDDARLQAFWSRRGVRDLDALRVIGYAHAGAARAYPVELLDRHELVNDTVGGKPVTVGW